jgi:hypothetical protein
VKYLQQKLKLQEGILLDVDWTKELMCLLTLNKGVYGPCPRGVGKSVTECTVKDSVMLKSSVRNLRGQKIQPC